MQVKTKAAAFWGVRFEASKLDFDTIETKKDYIALRYAEELQQIAAHQAAHGEGGRAADVAGTEVAPGTVALPKKSKSRRKLPPADREKRKAQKALMAAERAREHAMEKAAERKRRRHAAARKLHKAKGGGGYTRVDAIAGADQAEATPLMTQIFVEVAGGATQVVSVKTDDTVAKLKQTIADKTGWPTHAQLLVFAGKHLDQDEETLAARGIEAHAAVRLSACVRGGGKRKTGGGACAGPSKGKCRHTDAHAEKGERHAMEKASGCQCHDILYVNSAVAAVRDILSHNVNADTSRDAVVRALCQATFNVESCAHLLTQEHAKRSEAAAMHRPAAGCQGDTGTQDALAQFSPEDMAKAVALSLANNKIRESVRLHVRSKGRRLQEVDTTGHCQFDAIAHQVAPGPPHCNPTMSVPHPT